MLVKLAAIGKESHGFDGDVFLDGLGHVVLESDGRCSHLCKRVLSDWLVHGVHAIQIGRCRAMGLPLELQVPDATTHDASHAG